MNVTNHEDESVAPTVVSPVGDDVVAELVGAKRLASFIDFGTRDLRGATARIVTIVAFLFGTLELLTSLGVYRFDSSIVERAVHIAFAFTLCFAMYPSRGSRAGRGAVTAWDLVLILTAVGGAGYIATQAERVVLHGDIGSSGAEVALGIMMTLVVLEGARRVIGPVMPLLAVVLIAYAVFGGDLPGVWAHRPFSIPVVAGAVYFSDRGIVGSLTGVSATVIASFLIFGAIIMRTGGANVFVDLARLLTGRTHGGSAKVSSVSSALFGTVSGSAIANVIVDGVFNIPLMKRSGYTPAFAAAVEGAASTGGQIVPPMLGAAAFVMAEFLGRPYSDVALAATIPAILYYAGLTAAIHFEALRNSRPTVPESLIPAARVVLSQLFKIAVPIAVLLALMTAGYSAELSVSVATLVAAFLFLAASRARSEFGRRLRELAFGLVDGAKGIVAVATLVVCAAIVIRITEMTALGVKFSQLIDGLSDGGEFVPLVLGMITMLLLGMGLPTTAAYVIGATVVAPALVHIGIPPMAAHMFIFYFAILSNISPPVAPAIYASSALAGANWVVAGLIALRLALSGFIIPFMFVYSPALLLEGDPWAVAWRFPLALAGVVLLSAGLMGFLRRRSDWLARILMIVAGLLLVAPSLETDLAGIALAGVVIAYEYVVPSGFWSRATVRGE